MLDTQRSVLGTPKSNRKRMNGFSHRTGDFFRRERVSDAGVYASRKVAHENVFCSPRTFKRRGVRNEQLRSEQCNPASQPPAGCSRPDDLCEHHAS